MSVILYDFISGPRSKSALLTLLTSRATIHIIAYLSCIYSCLCFYLSRRELSLFVWSWLQSTCMWKIYFVRELVVSDCWHIWWYLLFLFDILYFKIFYPCFVWQGTSMGNSVELVKFRASKIIYPTPFPLSNLLTQSSLWELLINSILKFILCIACFKKHTYS